MDSNCKKHIKQQKILRKRQTNKSQSQQQENGENSFSNYQKYFVNNKSRGEHGAKKQSELENQLEKGKKWWQYINNLYFKEIHPRDINLYQNLVSGQKLSNYFHDETELKGFYKDLEIIEKYPILQDNHLIHAMFKSFTSLQYQLISFSFANYSQSLNRRVNKISEQQQQSIQPQISQWKISPLGKAKGITTILQGIQDSEIKEIIKNCNFQYYQSLSDSTIISKMFKYLSLKVQSQSQLQEQTDFELKLWKYEQNEVNSLNNVLWSTLLRNFQQKKNAFLINPKIFDQEIFAIKQELMHHTILRYFELGTKDKTNAMLKTLEDNLKLLKPQKTRDSNLKKFFQTDCKICFCSFNSDTNQVLYCDSCNTSFHLACYGLHEIPPEIQYFCDCCLQKRNVQKLQKVSLRKVYCQICCKANFPIKCIDGHFYHMTCLVIFNFITIKQGKIQLKDNQTHENILKKIISCELQCQRCIFCSGSQGSESGMRFKCSFENCKSSMHPICAYIHGCLFNVKKNMKEKKLDAQIFCNKHDCQRNYIEQSYLRRYMCNFKNTSQKSFIDFQAGYKAELQTRINTKDFTDLNDNLPKLLFDSKNVKRFFMYKQQKIAEKNAQNESTETRKMLEKLVKSNA